MPTDEEMRLKALEDSNAENALLRAGTCPRCKGSIDSKPDGRRQSGASVIVGAWRNYKCSGCGYVCDLIHPDNN